MILDSLGAFAPGSTIYIPWNSTAQDGSSITYSDASLKITKNGGTVERSSPNGVTLTSVHDGDTGTNLVTIDTSDDTDAGFYENGAAYQAKFSATVDGKAVTFWIVSFSLVTAPLPVGTDDLQPILGENGSILAFVPASDIIQPVLDEYAATSEIPTVTIEVESSDTLQPILAESAFIGWMPPAILPIVSLPDGPFQYSRFVLQGNAAELISPVSRSVQTLELLGSRWLATYQLPPMLRADAETWVAFLARLKGMGGRFYGYDPGGANPRGALGGTPRINGANQAGTTLATDGWTAGISGVLLTGDFVAFDTPSGWRELHMVTTDASSDGSGQATLQITPPLRESPADNAALILSPASCVMRLVEDASDWTVDDAEIYGVTFSGEETFVSRERA